MALNASLLKKPIVLVIGGAALIGGIYISSRIKAKSAARELPPTEVTPSVTTVTASGDVERYDTQNRALAEAQQKLSELEEKSRQAQIDYANSTDSERARYQAQLDAQGLTLSNQYSSTIESLKRQIADLLAKSAPTPTPIPAPPNTPTHSGGVPQPGLPERPPSGTIPVPAPIETVATPQNYTPGYGINYKYNCGLVPVHNNTLSWEQFVQNEKNKNIGGGWNNTAQMRNLAQIAISGTASKGVQTKGSAYGPVTITNTNRIYTNNVRAAWGLRPLTAGEWTEAQALMNSLWNGDEKANAFQSGSYARTIFERYNLPYRCTDSRNRQG